MNSGLARQLATTATLVVGGLIGIGLREWTARPEPQFPTPTQTEPKPHIQPVLAKAPDESANLKRKLDELTLRFDRYETESQRLRSDASSSITQPVPVPFLSQADAKAAAFRERDAHLAEFDQEPLDPVWAPRMRAEIEDGLKALSQSASVHFTSSVECRTTRCVARISWPNFGLAKAEFMIADTPSTVCARSLTLDEPRDESSPTEAKLIYICNNINTTR